MKLLIHASIFSAAFAGILAGALTTKATPVKAAHHSIVISNAMPVPTCPLNETCGL